MLKQLFIPLSFVALTSILFTACSSSSQQGEKKIVYMNSYDVFSSFEMKKDYDKLMDRQLFKEKQSLDLLGNRMNVATNQDQLNQLKKEFYVQQTTFNERFEQLSKQYTSKVNERLNEYIKEFGKNNNYGLIIGTGAEGNIMYVDEQDRDVTKALIAYINKRYKK